MREVRGAGQKFLVDIKKGWRIRQPFLVSDHLNLCLITNLIALSVALRPLLPPSRSWTKVPFHNPFKQLPLNESHTRPNADVRKDSPLDIGVYGFNVNLPPVSDLLCGHVPTKQNSISFRERILRPIGHT